MDELLFVYPVFIHIKGELRYKPGLTFSLRPGEANCVPENSLQRRCLYEAEWSNFPSLERGQPGPHHLGQPKNKSVFHRIKGFLEVQKQDKTILVNQMGIFN
ncbi:hypothetical protein XENORESO_018562 [Xenotaenia resolanae]|uniref:Uncharacterized protein n=1 Tax=Xenotaenia resolanae TaxID=208358 RepID=A0ABV0VU63_9TELE